MSEEAKKKLDENWKKQVEKEKKQAEESKTGYYKPDFSNYLLSLVMQAMIFLGKIENPLTKKVEKNYDQARMLIDTLEMLREKTKNNLTKEEATLLEDYLFNLRMVYVEEKK
ncbi:MAG: DUF1844 domain-containing protein [Candidatus Omnitrophica bacterium]|nr:DUF1844 domain-containing protein [Candidatus Omnitrophota bacterium]MDD5429751.1 DUF1844 domain-containing protein [Candidatus Omnitrophota bacterium]